MCGKEMKDQIQKMMTVEHPGVKCRDCTMEPIIGIRFKSITNPDVNLCEVCEASETREDIDELYLQIRTPEAVLPSRHQLSVSLHAQFYNIKEESPKRENYFKKESTGEKKNNAKPFAVVEPKKNSFRDSDCHAPIQEALLNIDGNMRGPRILQNQFRKKMALLKLNSDSVI